MFAAFIMACLNIFNRIRGCFPVHGERLAPSVRSDSADLLPVRANARKTECQEETEMLVSEQAFLHVFPKAPLTLPTLFDLYFPAHGLKTRERIAAFLAQCGHESAGFTVTRENLNYSAKALQSVFRKYFPTAELAEKYARKPEMIANRVYANRMGNGDEKSGDGWHYRGRGFIQLTGKANYYELASDMHDMQYYAHPELLEQPSRALLSALWFWDKHRLNDYADKCDIRGITKIINGGYNGLEDRLKLYERLIIAL